MSYTQTATPYSSGFRTPQALARRRSFSGHATSFAYSPRTGYDDYSRYGYGNGNDGATGAYDEYTGYGDTQAYPSQATTSPYPQSGYAGYTGAAQSGYTTPRQSTYYGNSSGAYDDLAVGTSRYDDYEYGSYPVTSLAPASRRRRSSSVSYYNQNQYNSGPSRASYYPSVATHRSTVVKFRAKASFRSGISLAEAVSGVKLSGGDYLRWHEINADARGKIFLRVKWTGYPALTYEIPVDSFDNRVRLSSLARRVGRACIHFMQSNGIQLSWDRVKLYHLEEVSQGTWQPALTIR